MTSIGYQIRKLWASQPNDIIYDLVAAVSPSYGAGSY